MEIHPTLEWDVVTPLDDSSELYNTQKTRFGGGLRPRRGTFGRRIRENLHFRPGNPLRKFRVATPRSDSKTHCLPIDYTSPWAAAAALRSLGLRSQHLLLKVLLSQPLLLKVLLTRRRRQRARRGGGVVGAFDLRDRGQAASGRT